MEHRILRAVPSDIADLIQAGEEASLSPWSAQNYIDELKLHSSVILKLTDGENLLVGFICARLISPGGDAGVEAEIYNVAIVASERRHGFGQMLFDAFLSEALRRQVRAVWLEVRESNNPALAFYRKNGFAIVQTRKNFYANPVENALLMKLDLVPS